MTWLKRNRNARATIGFEEALEDPSLLIVRDSRPRVLDGERVDRDAIEGAARGQHAVRVLQDKKDFTLDSLIATAYDNTCNEDVPSLDEALRWSPVVVKALRLTEHLDRTR